MTGPGEPGPGSRALMVPREAIRITKDKQRDQDLSGSLFSVPMKSLLS